MVVEKTGYPREMLDLDLDMEADLGVDTVKQAEIFAAIREAYGIPRDANLKLRDLPTLARVIQFVHDRRPDLKPAAPTADVVNSRPGCPAPSQRRSFPGGRRHAVRLRSGACPASPAADAIRDKVLAIVVEKTGYPKEMLDPDLDLEADLGVDTVKQAEMFAAVRAAFGIPRDQSLKLRDFPTLGHVIRFARERAAARRAAGGSGKPPAAAGFVRSRRPHSAARPGRGAAAPARTLQANRRHTRTRQARAGRAGPRRRG